MAAATALALVGAGTAIYGAVNQKKAAKKQAAAIQEQARYQRSMFGINTRIAEDQATDAFERGEYDATALKLKVRGMIGSQRASLAAQGIEVDSGSALDVQVDTADLGAQDVSRIKVNAIREAYGFKVEAMKASMSSEMTSRGAEANARNTILAGNINMVSGIGGAVGSLSRVI